MDLIISFTPSSSLFDHALYLAAGGALVEAGETYKTLADVKYSLEDDVKQNFIEPLQHIQTKDLKEVNVSVYIFII